MNVPGTKQRYLEADEDGWQPEDKLESVANLQNAVKRINEVTKRQAGERITIRSILEGGMPMDEEDHHDESEAGEHVHSDSARVFAKQAAIMRLFKTQQWKDFIECGEVSKSDIMRANSAGSKEIGTKFLDSMPNNMTSAKLCIAPETLRSPNDHRP